MKERTGEAEAIEMFQAGTFIRRDAVTDLSIALDGIAPLEPSVSMDDLRILVSDIGGAADGQLSLHHKSRYWIFHRPYTAISSGAKHMPSRIAIEIVVLDGIGSKFRAVILYSFSKKTRNAA